MGGSTVSSSVTLNISGIINVPLDSSSVAGIVTLNDVSVKSSPTGACKHSYNSSIPMLLITAIK